MSGPLPRRDVVGFFGVTGSGKTQAVRARLRGRYPRRIYFDPMADYAEGIDAERVAEDRAGVVDYLDGLGPAEPFSVAYRPPPEDDEPDAVGFLSRLAWGARDCVLVVDEAHVACHHLRCSPHALLVVRRGRHRGVSVFVVSQRPADVHPSIRSECYACESYFFRISRTDDLRDLAAERGTDFSDAVAHLPRLEAFRLTEDGLARVRVEFPRGVPALVSA